MSTRTTTIRVSIRTRDRLAAQARERGISVATLLADLAKRAEREEFFREERDATLVDSANPAVHQEQKEWDETVGDGID